MDNTIAKTDYLSLQCGYPEVSRTQVSIVGLQLQVFGLDEIRDSELPVAVVIATHGRLNKKEQMEPFAHGLLGSLAQSYRGKRRRRDVIVVTLDQRNHGSRLRDPNANFAYDKNQRHLTDMSAQVVGGCQDVSLVMDFLASYIFPHGEKVIDEFIATGFSLGGHLTWRLLREGIPLLGLPFSSFSKYLKARAHNMSYTFAPPLVPPNTASFLDIPTAVEKYDGKRILSIHGKEDTLVPYIQGKPDIDAIKEYVNRSRPEPGPGPGPGTGAEGEGELGKMQVEVIEGAGHVLLPEMVRMVAGWVGKWAVWDEEDGDEDLSERRSKI